MGTRIPGVHFEAVAEPAAAAGGGEPIESPDATIAPEPDPIEAPAVEAPAEETPAGPDYSELLSSPEAQAAIDRATEARLAEMFQEEPEAPADPLADFDFLADDAPQRLAQVLEQRDQRLLAQFRDSPAIQHADQEYARQWADDQFGVIEGKLGAGVTLDEEARRIAIFAANGMGFDPKQAPQVLEQTATGLHKYVQAQRDAAVEAYKQGLLSPDGDQQAEPGPGGAATIQTEDLSSLSYLDLAHRHFGG